MKRIAFLAPAAGAGTATALVAVFAELGATATYVLFGLVGLAVVGSRIFIDLYGEPKRGKVVEMNQSAVRAEQYDRPISGERRIGFHEWDEDRIVSDYPVLVAARRAWPQPLFFKKLDQRRMVTFSHGYDPTQRQPV
jgi:hypothetical protein